MSKIKLILADEDSNSLNELKQNFTDDKYEIIATREYCENINNERFVNSIAGEITLNENEALIDEIICNVGTNVELTNKYIKNNELFLEGIIYSNLIYLDENKNLQSKKTELPFILNTKIKRENLNTNSLNLSATEVKTKSKRGNIVEMEYVLTLNFVDINNKEVQLVDSFTIGGPLNFSKYDYQIFVAKPEETLWDLCKRIKMDSNEILKYNPNLSPILKGGERVVVKR